MADNILSLYARTARGLNPQNVLAQGYDDEAQANALALGYGAARNGLDRDAILPWAYEVKDGVRSQKGQLAWPQIAADAWKAMTDVGSAPLLGRYNPAQRDEMIEGAGAVVGPMAGVGMAAAPSNALGIFGGRLAKTADRNKLAAAEWADKTGVPREQIWSDTGWFKGPDKKWRFEINDSNARVNELPSVGDIAELPDVLSHADLFRAYPDMSRMAFERLSDRNRMEGYHSGDTIGAKGGPDTGSVLLHELQHGIQGREGFAAGGNMDTAAALKAESVRQRFAPTIETLQAQRSRLAVLRDEAMQKARDTLQVAEDSPGLLRRGKRRAAMADAEQATKAAEIHQRSVADYDAQLADVTSRMEAALSEAERLDPFDRRAVYGKLAGEVESRAVEARRNLTPEQRAARPPWLDYDVPESQQLVTYGGGPQYSLPEQPGIKYLDQGSRSAGEGSRNYVVFDDALVSILRKYGLLPPAVAGAAAASGQDQAQARP